MLKANDSSRSIPCWVSLKINLHHNFLILHCCTTSGRYSFLVSQRLSHSSDKGISKMFKCSLAHLPTYFLIDCPPLKTKIEITMSAYNHERASPPPVSARNKPPTYRIRTQIKNPKPNNNMCIYMFIGGNTIQTHVFWPRPRCQVSPLMGS